MSLTLTWQCAMCKQTFDRGWSHEEAVAEKNKLFGDISLEECEQVCDDCFQLIKPISYNEFRVKVRKDMADVYRKINNHAMRRLLYKVNIEAERKMTNLIMYGVSEI